jgi:hypothetical protein
MAEALLVRSHFFLVIPFPNLALALARRDSSVIRLFPFAFSEAVEKSIPGLLNSLVREAKLRSARWGAMLWT